MRPRGNFCLFCGGDASAKDHLSRCDGRQGGIEDAPLRAAGPRRVHEFKSAFKHWPRQWSRDHPAFAGLSAETIDAICDDTINDAMIRAFWRVLEDGLPRLAHDVIRALEKEPWWKPRRARSSKERFVRKILDTAVARGYSICGGNFGYAIGDAAMLRAAARRERALERGARDKAAAYERLAEALEKVSA